MTKYQPRTKPRGHQVEARRRRLARPSRPSSEDVFAWLMEYGTGKSKVVVDEYGEREAAGEVQDLLLLAEAGSYLNWVEDKNENQLSQFHAHASDDLNDRLLVSKWVSGAGTKHMRALEHMLKSDRPRVLAMNIEALSASKKAQDLAMAFVKSGRGRRAMMVVDECTSIKNPTAQRTKEVIKLAGEAPIRRALTGLVTPNSPMDLFSPFEYLDWRILGLRSFYAFQARYAVLKPIQVEIPGQRNPDGSPKTRKVNIEVAYRNLDELNEKIAPYSYRVLTKDCLDLPPLVYAPMIDVELTDEQRRLYKELRDNATAELSSQAHVTATMVITRNLRLQQLLTGFIVDEDGVEHDVPSNRGRDLLQILGNHSGKAIIWCPFHNPLQKIVRALTKEYGPKAVAQFHGNNKSTRAEDERRFLGDPECRFMVSTQAAGGRGNTWVVANLMVYFANDENLELRMNSERRFYRDGQTMSCTIIDMNAAGTNEMKTIQRLRDKLDMAAVISGDGYREWLI